MGKPKHFKYRKITRHQYQTNIARRNREVRDLYNRLRPKFTEAYVTEFFMHNYFMNESATKSALVNSDKEPVDLATASIQYKTAIKEDFNL